MAEGWGEVRLDKYRNGFRIRAASPPTFGATSIGIATDGQRLVRCGYTSPLLIDPPRMPLASLLRLADAACEARLRGSLIRERRNLEFDELRRRRRPERIVLRLPHFSVSQDDTLLKYWRT